MTITNLKLKTYNFLRWTEKWTQTDMVYLAKDGSWLAVGQAITIITAILTALAFANLLPVEIYGTYKYIFSIVSLLSIPTLSGVSTAIIQAVARGSDGTLYAATKIKMRWGLLSAIASLGLAGYYYYGNNPYLALSFLVAAVFLPLMDPLNVYNAYLNGKKEFKLNIKFNIINQAIILAVMVGTIWLTNNIWLIILVYFSANTTTNALFYYLAVKRVKPNSEVNQEALSYGKHLTVMNIISLIAGQLDKILIWHFLGAAQLAIYALAMAPIDQVNSGILRNASTLAMPKLSNNDGDTLKKTLPGKIFKLTGLTVVAALAYIFVAPFLYEIAFPKYIASVIYSRFYVLTLVLLPFSLFNIALTAQEQKKKLYFLSLTIGVVKITLLLIFLPLYGIAGAIAAIIGSTLYSNLTTYYLFKKI